MIEGIITTPQTLSSNTSVVTFVDSLRTRSANCCGWLQHENGSPLYEITECGIYDVTFNGNVTSATAGIVALGLSTSGIVSTETIGAETLATAGDLANISFKSEFRVCPNGSKTISVASVPSVLAGATLVPTDTQIPIITNGTLVITKKK